MRAAQDKNRDMARSILPSRYRSPVAEQAKARRRNRRTVKQHLRTIRTIEDVEEWDEDQDCRAYPNAEIKQIVRWRRNGDKINHFERWAVRSTAELPRDNRLSHLRSVLPNGLIGDHAMSHLRRLPELRPSNAGYSNRDYYAIYRAWWEEEDRARHAWLSDLETALKVLYDHGGQRQFNRDMRRAWGQRCFDKSCPHRPRCANRAGLEEPPLIRVKGDIASVVSRALLVSGTSSVLLTHARRYRPSLNDRPGF